MLLETAAAIVFPYPRAPRPRFQTRLLPRLFPAALYASRRAFPSMSIHRLRATETCFSACLLPLLRPIALSPQTPPRACLSGRFAAPAPNLGVTHAMRVIQANPPLCFSI